jgi:hypothetical protein
MSDELKELMRRVYVEYTNRIGPRVNLTNQEIQLLQDADWFGLLKVPKIRYNLRANTVFDPQIRDEEMQAFDVARSHASHRLEQLPVRLGPMRLIGFTCKRSNDATVCTQSNHTISKDSVNPIKNFDAHLKQNEARSQTVLFSRQAAGIPPFPIDDFKGVGVLHLVMQLPALRSWLWGEPPTNQLSNKPAQTRRSKFFEPPHGIEEWLAENQDAAGLWAGRLPSTQDPLVLAVEAVRNQKDLTGVVTEFDRRRAGLSGFEAAVLRRATEIELQRRELKDLMAEWNETLSDANTPNKQYQALLLCRRQVCRSFLDLDWELDGEVRDFTRKVESALNDPRFMKQWQPVSIVNVNDGELANSLVRALHIVNAQRAAPVKLRWPVPHEVFKTWVTLQQTYGPADDFPSPAEFGLRMSPTQRQLRDLVWRNFDQSSEDDSPQSQYERMRLQPALDVLTKFKQGQYTHQQMLDAVRRCPKMRLLIDDIVKITK